ncbi:MAG: hypothetical protein E6H55_08705, partial [Betaproteobacteria bacterium]
MARRLLQDRVSCARLVSIPTCSSSGSRHSIRPTTRGRPRCSAPSSTRWSAAASRRDIRCAKPSLQQRLERALGVPVLQAYAMTEGGGIAHDPLPPARRKAGSVGLTAGCEVRVLDEGGKFLPVGAVGEIIVRGCEVFGGYEDDPEANALAFHDGWFRTGDLGYLDGDGYIYLTGRMKEAINRGGFKVSPTAVDAALMQHSQVADAATFGVPHPTLGEDVIAAVVARAPGSVSEQELRDFALQRLAGFMVPTRIVFMSELPKTALGKVRRHALADTFGIDRRIEFTPPRDAH